jgi:hypothetical protein
MENAMKKMLCILGLMLLTTMCTQSPSVEPTTAVADTAVQPTADSPVEQQVDEQPVGQQASQQVWIDPVNGDDSRTGDSRATALRTLTEAWNRIPQGTPLTTGYELMLMAGNYPESSLPNYLESRYGTAAAPIVIQAADGVGTAVLQGDLNIYDTRYLTLQQFQIIPNPPGDAFHCEQCQHITLRGMVLSGGNREAHETVKINQSQYIFIEDSDISGADDNAIDYVAVQYGHIIGSRIHNAGDWCLYAKGGSAYLRIEGNEIFNCGTGGFTAGQGTGLEFMTAPWLHYEAYDLKFINNLVHDTEGAGMGVNGGYNILLAYNTLYKVGQNSHAVEVVYGLRSCDGNTAVCQANLDQGAWGTTVNIAQSEGESIPDQNIAIFNNLIYNPTGYASQWQHFAIYGPRVPSADSNLPNPVHTDINLVIQGNVIWNGSSQLPLGIEEGDQGCQPTNPTCNAAQLLADNWINQFEPQLVNPEANQFAPAANSNLYTAAARPIPDFSWADAPAPPLAPPGTLSNAVLSDFYGRARAVGGPVGAFLEEGSANLMFSYLPLIVTHHTAVVSRPAKQVLHPVYLSMFTQ